MGLTGNSTIGRYAQALPVAFDTAPCSCKAGKGSPLLLRPIVDLQSTTVTRTSTHEELRKFKEVEYRLALYLRQVKKP